MIEENQPYLKLKNTSSSLYSKSRVEFKQDHEDGWKYWLFSELGTSYASTFFLRGLDGSGFVNYLRFEQTTNDIRFIANNRNVGMSLHPRIPSPPCMVISMLKK